MAVVKRKVPTDVESFLAWENRQKLRYELIDGVVYLMAGGTRAHDLIATNVIRAIGNGLVGTPCQVHGSNLKVRSPAEAVVYPDAFIRCGPIADHVTVVDDPLLVVEVLSKRTREYDMYGKQLAYYAIPSLRHLLLIEPGAVAVRHESRQPDGTWLLRLFRDLDSTVEIDEPRLSLPLRAIYAGTALAG
ncbi:MAG: Uma2 family endonuclease [Geminicoccaceae bacterium]|nr:Uma2 family endonuclease [Geminicoccaceae bacterium]